MELRNFPTQVENERISVNMYRYESQKQAKGLDKSYLKGQEC